MADNIIRHDIVQIDWKVNDSQLNTLNKEVKGFENNVTRSVSRGEGQFGKLNKSVQKAAGTVKGFANTKLSKLTSSAKDMTNKFLDSHSAAKKLATSVKGVAKTSVSKLKSGFEAIKNRMAEGVTKAKEYANRVKEFGNTTLDKLKRSLGDVDRELDDVSRKARGSALTAMKKLASVTFKAVAAGIATCATAVGGLTLKAVQAYARFEQLEGGVQTLFGDSATTVLKNADKAFRTAGLSANDYMDTVTSFSASLIQSLGGDTDKAAKMANKAIIDMSDNANKMGTDMQSIQYAYQGFAKQNYTMLDNLKLGYGGTKTEMERLLKDAEKISGKKFDLSSYADVVEAIHIIQKEMGIAGTTAKEANETIEGSFYSMKSAWGNLLPALIKGGKSFDIAMDNMVSTIAVFAKNALPAVERALEGIGELIERAAPMIQEKLPVVIDKLLPPLIKAAAAIVGGLIAALPSIVVTLVKEIPSILGTIGDSIADALGIEGKKVQKAFAVFAGALGGAGLLLLGKFKAGGIINKLKGLFGGGKGNDTGSQFGGGIFEKLAKISPKVILKGMANLAIVLGGLLAISAVFMKVSPYLSKMADPKSLAKLMAVVTGLGVIGSGLALLAGKVGNIPVMAVVKGLANIAIIIGGLTALYVVLGAASLLKFDLNRVTQLIKIIGITGLIGSALTGLAGLIGLIPTPVVLSGLANIALVLGGMTGLVVAFGALSRIKGFNEFITSGGDLLAKLFGQIGKIAGSLVGGLGEGISASLPKIGQNLSKFAMSVKPMLTAFKGADVKGIGAFFKSMGSFMLKMAGGNLLSKFTGGLQLGKIGKELNTFATKSKGFFTTVAKYPENSFSNAKALFKALAAIGKLPKSGGLKGWFSGETDWSGITSGLKKLSGKGVMGFFTAVSAVPASGFKNGKSMFKALSSMSKVKSGGGWSGLSNLGKYGEQLSKFGNKASSFFKQVNGVKTKSLGSMVSALKKLGNLKSVNLKITGSFNKLVSSARKTSSSVVKTVSSMMSKVKSSVTKTNLSSAGGKMMDSLRKGISNKKSAILNTVSSIVKSVVSRFNRTISAGNHVLSQFGAKTRLSAYKYAKGTGGHKGGNALVNDGRGAELIQMPNGKTFIPNGKNVFIPNAPKGMKVLNAQKTAEAMGKGSPTFKYAKGTGSFDATSYTSGKALANKMISSYVSYSGMSGVAKAIAQAGVATIKKAIPAWAQKIINKYGIGKNWKWPSKTHTITSGFGRRKSPGGIGSTNHMGIDIGAPFGSSVYASKGGKVTAAGYAGGYGNLVSINHGGGWNTLYGHNSKLLVSAGSRVRQGQTIAKVGSTGNSTGPHIHFGMKKGGGFVNPLKYLSHKDGVGMKEVKLPQDGGVGLSRQPSSGDVSSRTNVTENNTYAPVFNLTLNGTVDRTTERTIKQWVQDAMEEVFDSMSRTNPRVSEV